MNRFIDIHTHNTPNDASSFILKNIILPNQKIPEIGHYSAGWHPWFIAHHTLTEIEDCLIKELERPQVIAIGECGIDRVVRTPLDVQQKVFEIHLRFALEYNKPIIVHAVRSYSDLHSIFKNMNFQLPVILHDYRGNSQQTSELLKFNTFFSFGESLFKQEKMKYKIREIPLTRLFFETDESLLSIEKIYLRAASVLDVSMDELSKQIIGNFKNIFGNGLVE